MHVRLYTFLVPTQFSSKLLTEYAINVYLFLICLFLPCNVAISLARTSNCDSRDSREAQAVTEDQSKNQNRYYRHVRLFFSTVPAYAKDK